MDSFVVKMQERYMEEEEKRGISGRVREFMRGKIVAVRTSVQLEKHLNKGLRRGSMCFCALPKEPTTEFCRGFEKSLVAG